jgi:hypothetical protein
MEHENTGLELLVQPDRDQLTPTQRLEGAAEIANALAGVIEQKKLYTSISGRRHVLAEGWQVLANLMQVGLETEWTRPVYDRDEKLFGWEARVICRAKDGQVIGSAESMCCRDEERWRDANEHALRSMAQTRAVSRALRQCIGFIVKLSGFEATPAEELDSSPPKKAPAEKAEADREASNRPITMTDRSELWEIAKKREAEIGYSAKDMIDVVCKELRVGKTKTGWTIRKKHLQALHTCIETFDPPESTPAPPGGDAAA